MAFPRIIPHSDGAGTIAAVGEGVPSSRVGEKVWIYFAQWKRPFGTAAEYVALPSRQAVRLPDQVDFAGGACLGIPALTAHRSLFSDGPVTGQTVLVAGGTGAVGYYAVQLAKWNGATVITTVSSPQKAEIARAAGADLAIDYKTEDVATRVRDFTDGAGVDRIIEVEFGTNYALDIELLKLNGVLASFGSDRVPSAQVKAMELARKNITLRFVLVYLMPEAPLQAAIADLTRCMEEGRLQHNIARRFPLEEIVGAHEAVESGQLAGNVVLDI